MLAQRDILPEGIRPLRRIEYEALVERGLLEDSRVELLVGALVDTTPQGPMHANVVSRLGERLVRQLPGNVQTRGAKSAGPVR